MEKALTGHLYFRSAHETSWDCGNCDEGKCDNCKPVYFVGNKQFEDPQEAIKFELEQRKIKTSLLIETGDVYSTEEPQETDFFIKDGKLFVTRWKCAEKGGNDYGQRDLPCNEASPAYADMFAKCEKRMNQYNECRCEDKDEDIECGPCCKFGCNDQQCYSEMKRGRSEKKWYM